MLEERHPHVQAAPIHAGPSEPFRSHADYRVGRAVQGENLTQNVGTPAQLVLPEVMAHHGHGVLTGAAILRVHEPPAHRWKGSKDMEVLGSGISDPDAPPPLFRTEGGVPLGPGGERLERSVRLSDVLEIGISPTPLIVSPNDGNHVDDPVLARHTGNRGEPHRMDRGERRGIHSDAHGEGDDGDEGEAFRSS